VTSAAAENEGVPEEGVLRRWKARKVSYPVANFVIGAIFGIGAVAVAAPSLLTSKQPGSMVGGLMFIVVGIVFLAQSVFFLLAPAWRVEELEGGHFRFIARRRTLTVGPGEVQSVRCIWMDPSRQLPMRLTSTRGSILIAPRMNDVVELYKALALANPNAAITNPLSIMSLGRNFQN